MDVVDAPVLFRMLDHRLLRRVDTNQNAMTVYDYFATVTGTLAVGFLMGLLFWSIRKS